MSREPEEPYLFDLPLAGPPPGVAAPSEGARSETGSRRSARRSARPESLPLFGEPVLESPEPLASETRLPAPSFAPIPAAPAARGPVAVPRPVEMAPLVEPIAESGPATASLRKRLRAACGDLAILLAAGAIAAVGARLLGAPLRPDSIPALLVFLLAFSFLYCVVSLAFWGQTPGMAWSGLIARTEVTEPLSFGQGAMRWVGHWLTWALLGLPGLLALSGSSLADRLSGSETYDCSEAASAA